MSNRIQFQKLESYPKSVHDQSETTKGRRAIRQGLLLKILSSESPKPHTGGGIRKPQQGHSERSEKKLYNFLCTCRPSNYFITLTFAKPTGPVEAKEAMIKFLRNLQNHLYFKPGAVAKMELQPARMCAEFMLFLWMKEGYSLEEELVQELWNKATDSQSQIKFEETDPDQWLDVSDYASKEVSVTDNCVTIGRVKFPVRLNDGGIFGSDDGDTLLLVTNPQYRAKLNISNTEITIDRSMFDAWRYYQGQYVMKKNITSIPRYPVEKGYIPDEMVNEIRYKVNGKRKTYFIRKEQYLSVTIGDSAENIFLKDSESIADTNLSGDVIDTDSNDFDYEVSGGGSHDNHSCSIMNKVSRYIQSSYRAVVSCCRKILQKIMILKE